MSNSPTLLEEQNSVQIYSHQLYKINHQKLLTLIDGLAERLAQAPLFESDENSKIDSFDQSRLNPSILDPLRNFLVMDYEVLPHGDKLLEIKETLFNEIKQFYSSYILIERELFQHLTAQLESKQHYHFYNILQLATKFKELCELLKQTKYFCMYIRENFNILRDVLKHLDSALSPFYNIGNISIKMLKRKFEVTNSDINYILQFRIVDEVSCVINELNVLLNKEFAKVKGKSPLLTTNENYSDVFGYDSIDRRKSFLSDEDKTALRSFEEMICQDKESEADAYNELFNLKRAFSSKIVKRLIHIDNKNQFRAKFVNLPIFVKYGFKITKETNTRNAGIIIEESQGTQEINCILDEENVINKILSRKAIKEYFDYHKRILTKCNTWNMRLIYMHHYVFIVAYAFSFFRLNYPKKDGEFFKQSFFSLSLIHFAMFISKLLFGFTLSLTKNFKMLLVISFFFLLCSFIISLLEIYLKEISHQCSLLSPIFLGLSCAKHIDSHYLVTFSSRVLIKTHISQFITMEYLFLSIGFALNVGITYIDNSEMAKIMIAIVLSGIAIILLLIVIIFFKSTTNPQFHKFKENMICPIKRLDKSMSVGKRKLLTEDEREIIDDANILLEKQNKSQKADEVNKIAKFIKILIQSEKRETMSYISKSFKGFLIVYLMTYIIFPMVVSFLPISISQSEKNILRNKQWTLKTLSVWNFLCFFGRLIGIKKKLKKFLLNCNIVFMILLCIGWDVWIYYTDNQIYLFQFGFSLVILSFSTMIELQSLKFMSKIIPQNWNCFGMNACLFIELVECLLKGTVFIMFFFFFEKLDKESKLRLTLTLGSFIGLFVCILVLYMIMTKKFHIKGIARMIKRNDY